MKAQPIFKSSLASTRVPSGILQRKCACGHMPGSSGECEECRKKQLQRKARNSELETRNDSIVPPIVHEVLRSPGQSLDATMRAFMEPRFGHDFSHVRVHTDSQAAESARAVQALAYTVGRDVVFGHQQYAPQANSGLKLIAHELAHVVQEGGGEGSRPQRISQPTERTELESEQVAVRALSGFGLPTRGAQTAPSNPHTLFRYRNRKAFNFGRRDTATLKEESFTDAKKQPWIQQIDIRFDGTKFDRAGALVPTGMAVATYHSNPALLPSISLPVTGGSTAIGLTDAGHFNVTRIEGIGYSDVPIPAPEGEGPRRKYSKSLAASMSYAVFFNRGQALHIGFLDLGSHACVHMGDDSAAWEKMQQINYHSVVGATKVAVSYDPAALKPLCCSRMNILGITRKGHASNPCKGEDPSACP